MSSMHVRVAINRGMQRKRVCCGENGRRCVRAVYCAQCGTYMGLSASGYGANLEQLPLCGGRTFCVTQLVDFDDDPSTTSA